MLDCTSGHKSNFIPTYSDVGFRGWQGAGTVSSESNQNGLENQSVRVMDWWDLASAHALRHPRVSGPGFTGGHRGQRIG